MAALRKEAVKVQNAIALWTFFFPLFLQAINILTCEKIKNIF